MARKLHTDSEYETQLETLRSHLLAMAGRVEEMIGESVRALADRDMTLAQRTIAKDEAVNRAELEVDEVCLLILAKRQPMASDLRFITLSLKMVTDLERIGDLAVNICERVSDLVGEQRFQALDDIVAMSKAVQSMVHDAIDAFVERDADKAEQVRKRDDDVDAAYTRIFRKILAVMSKDPTALERGIHVQSVAKWLERMGDHSTNLAEQVIFYVRGTDVRHPGLSATDV